MNQLMKIEPTQLEDVVKNSGLAIQDGEDSKLAYLPFLSELSEIQSQTSKINFDNPTDIDEKIARELRLKIVKIRTGSSSLKDSRKKIHLLRGNLEQAADNLISASCKLTEEVLFNVEKARELKEKQRKESLMIERLEKLSTICEDALIYPLGELSEEAFNDLYLGMKAAKDAKLKAEQEAEEKRLAEIEAEKKRQAERDAENLRLKAEAEAKEKQLLFERKKAEELAEKERIANAKVLAEQKAKAEKERKRLEAIALEEQNKKNELERQLREKEAKELAEKQAKEKAEKERITAEKKAAKAPDKEKLISFINSIQPPVNPSLNSEEANMVLSEIQSKFQGFKNWAQSEISKL